MKSCQKLSGFLVSLVVAISSIITPATLQARSYDYDYDNNNSGLIAGLCTAGAVVLGACALGTWLSKPSNDDLIESAQRECKAASKYNAVVQETLYPQSNDEATLERLAQILSGVSIRSYTADMKNAVKRLDKKHAQLIKRMRSLDCCCGVYQDMKQAAEHVAQLSADLTAAARYVSTHKSYFALAKTEQSMANAYAQEFDVCDHCQHDKRAVARELRPLIMQYGKRVQSAYPYLDYVDALARDTKVLAEALAQVEYDYPILNKSAHDMSVQLAMIKRVVMGDPAYAQALEKRERDRIVQEQLRIQREQARMQQQLIAQNQQLIADLEYERRKPQKVVVVEKQRPARPVVVQPVVVEPIVPVIIDPIIIEPVIVEPIYYEPAPAPTVKVGYAEYNEDGSFYMDVEI